MTDDDRRRFESIFQLYELAWKQFNERRNYEFKVTLTLWTALAAAIAGSMTLAVFPPVPFGRLLLAAIAIFSFALHALWCRGLGRAQNGERFVAFSYEPELQKIAGAGFDQRTKSHLAELKGTMGLLKNWTFVFQLGVTFLLVAVLLTVNWKKFDPEPAQSIRQLETTKLELEVEKLKAEVRSKQLDAETRSQNHK
jgi:membrane protein implicated in regulation of membrane protease activity